MPECQAESAIHPHRQQMGQHPGMVGQHDPESTVDSYKELLGPAFLLGFPSKDKGFSKICSTERLDKSAFPFNLHTDVFELTSKFTHLGETTKSLFSILCGYLRLF